MLTSDGILCKTHKFSRKLNFDCFVARNGIRSNGITFLEPDVVAVRPPQFEFELAVGPAKVLQFVEDRKRVIVGVFLIE